MNDNNTLLQERTELFDNALNFRPNKRIPTMSNIFTWKFLDAGFKLSEVLYDYDKIDKVMDDFIETYQYDGYLDLGTRNPLRIFRAVGGGFHKIGKTDDFIEVQDHVLMERNEYKELTRNPIAFYWSKVFPRILNKPKVTMGDIENIAKEIGDLFQYTINSRNKLLNTHQAFATSNGNAMLPFETIFNFLRGIKESSLDVRKCKSEMKEAMDVMFETEIGETLDATFEADATGCVAPVMVALLGHSVLSVQQFEELEWPYLKKVLDTAVKHKKPVYIFCESTMLRFAEFFQDYPKGTMVIHLEQDDILEIRKKLPNVALCGGMPADLLGHGTPEQCVDHARKIADSLGEGFILSQQKMISFRNDAKRENLIAVNEFAKNYSC